MAEVIIHFHGGPYSGCHRVVERHAVAIVPGSGPAVNLVPDLFLNHPARGSYVRDETSAGGRCYDWKD